MGRRVRVAIVGVAAVMLVLGGSGLPAGAAGDASPADTAKQTEFKPYRTGAVKRGGTMTFIGSNDISTLDNAKITMAVSQQSPAGDAIYGTLLWYDATTGKLHMVMADSLATKDGTNWVLKLKPGIKFTDGTPLDAAAVKFNWERLKDPLLGSAARQVANAMSSLTVVDPLTLNITLAQPNYSFPVLFGHFSINWIGSPTAIQSMGADYGKKPVGAGPFMVQSYTPAGGGLMLVRNPNYFDKGLPYLDAIKMLWNPDNVQGIQTVAAGQANAVTTAQRAQDLMGVQSGLGAVAETTGGGPGLTFNVKKPPFNDVTARQAVSLAVNPNVINESVFNGNEQPAINLFAPGTIYYDKTIKLPMNFGSGVNAQAQKLFDQYASTHGGPLQFSITRNPSLTSVGLAQSIQTQLASYKNVNVSIEALDAATFVSRLFGTGNFESVIAGANGDPEPGLSEALLSTGANNYGGFNNPDVDAALNHARSTADVKARRDDYIKLQKLFNDTVPVVFTNHLTYGIVFDKDTTGWQIFGLGNPLMDQVGFAKTSKK